MRIKNLFSLSQVKTNDTTEQNSEDFAPFLNHLLLRNYKDSVKD